MWSTATVMEVAIKNQIATYRCFSRRFQMVPNRLTEKTTQIRAMAMSIGHSSSAYSLLVVNPSGSVTAAATMIAFHPQKLIQLSLSLNIRALQRRCSE